MRQFRRWLAYMGATYGYTPRQSKELLALLVASVFFLGIPIVYKYWLLQQPLAEVALPTPVLLDSLPSANPHAAENQTTLSSTPFDPNTATQSAWVAHGTSAWLAKRIQHYLAKGGHFKKAEDVKRIYDFPEDLYQKLRPYFLFPNPEINVRLETREKTDDRKLTRENSQETAPTPYPILDINTADSSALEALPGLGPVMAKRIVKYRTVLGGFANLQQLYEVYGQDSSRTLAFIPFLKIYKGEGLVLLDINGNAREGKLYHPYLPKLSAKLISAYVRQHGNLARPEQLLEHHLIDSAHYYKLLPYLSF